METDYPKISRKGSSILVTLSSEKKVRRVDHVDFILDIESKIQNLIGIEILNLAEIMESQVLRLENFEGFVNGINWKVSYEPEYDVAYVGFQKGKVTSSKTRQEKGTVLINAQKNIVGFEIELK